MIIKELTVEAFRGLADGTYELPEGLTIVRGPNEVGKSTFQMAILTALFGDPTSSAQQWKRLHRWNAGRKLRVELVFEEDGEGWELVRDFETGKSQLKNLQTGELTDGRDAVDEKLQEVAPVTTESVYNATACLHQQDLAGLQAGGELRDMLSRSMTGGADEAAASQVSRIIGSEISSTYTKGRRGGDPGLYQGLKRTLQELKDKQERITQEAEKTQEARQFIAEHEDEFERLQQDLENRQKLFERVSKRREKEEALQTLEKECDELSNRIAAIEKLQRQIEQLKGDIEDLPEVDEEALEQLRDLQSSAKSQQEQIETQQKKLEEIRQNQKRIRGELQQAHAAAQEHRARSGRMKAGFVAAGIAAIAAVALGIGGISGWWVGLIVAVAAGAWAWTQRPTSPPPDVKEIESRLNAAKTEAEIVQGNITQAEAAMEQAESKIADRLKDHGFQSIDELRKAVDDRRKRVEEYNTKRSNLDVMLGDDDPDELRRTLASKQADRDRLADELDSAEWLDAAMEPEQMRDLREAIERMSARVQDLQQRLQNARYTLQHSDYDIEDKQEIDAKVRDTQKRLDRLKLRWEALEMVQDVLDEAQQATMTSAMDRLGPEINSYLERLTEGRYDRVQMEDMQPSVYSSEKADFADPDDELSLATREQVYLACRLAFTRLLWEDDGPPVMLDDPLVNFDRDRRAAALEILREMAKNRQVLIFTCADEYSGSADNLVELAGVS